MRFIFTKPHRTHTKAPSALLTASLKHSPYKKYVSCFCSLSSRIWNLGAGSKIITTLALVSVVLIPFFFLVSNTNAAPNYQMNYQGKLTNASNVAVADGTYNMRFWLLTTSSIATTSAIWTESLTGTNKVQVTNGLFSVMLGSTSPLTSVDFNQTLYLGVEIGGTSTASWDGEMSPRKVLGTVPAAFEADRLDGLTSTQFVRTDATSSISASTADTLLSITQNGVGDILNLFDGTDEVFSVLDGGNVGIGTTSPSRKFTVGGDAWFGGNLTGTGTLSITGLATLGYASTTGLTATNAYLTNATTSNLKVTGLTGSRALFTDANSLLTTSGVSQYLIDAITDETGTGSLVFSTNPLLAGFRSSASSTIGDGTGAGGLTIDGNSTTTLNQYVAGASMVGSQNAFITDGYEFSASGRSFFYDASQHTDYDLSIEHSGGSSYSGTVNATVDKSNGIDETLAPYHAGVYGTQNGKNTYALLGIRRIEATWDPTPTALTTGTYLPGIGFAGPTDTTDGSGTVIGASLGAIVDGTVSAGFLPSALVFHTSTSSSAGLMERMRITSTGTIGIGTTTPSKLLTVAGDIFTPNNISAGSSTITYASSTGLTVTGNTYLTYASTTGISGTNLAFTNGVINYASTTGLSATNLAISGNTTLSGLSDGCLSAVSGLVTSSGVACGSGSGSASDWRLVTGGGAITPTSTVGIAVFASSTIGGGSTTTGLTINGGATTTHGAYFGGPVQMNAGLTVQSGISVTSATYGAFCISNAYVCVGRDGQNNLVHTAFNSIVFQDYLLSEVARIDTQNKTFGIGTTSPSATLAVVGSGTRDLFRFASSTGSSMLALDSRGVVNFGSTATSSIYFNGGPLASTSNQNSNNIGIGNGTLTYLSPNLGADEGGYNIALGSQALAGSSTVLMTGIDNIALGRTALSRNTTGGQNIALGVSALSNNDSGGDNIALGSNALSISRSSGQNVAIGLSALYQIVRGEDNVAVGSYAGSGAGSLTTDISYNTFLGASAGTSLVRGDKNIAIGYRADLASSTGSNQLNIGNLIYGTGFDGTFSTLSTGNIGIGSTTPSRKLTVAGDIFASGRVIAASSTITYASSTGLTATNATFTGATSSSLYTTTLGLNSEYFTDLTGSGLQNTSNALTCITSNSSTFGCLTSADWTIFNDKVSSSSIDTSAELASLMTDETGSAGNLVFSGNPLLAGFRSNASSTIGDGTQTGGLTINGGATTTLNAYFGGTLSLGSTSPSAKLTVVGTAGAGAIFRLASSTGVSLLALDSRGVLTFGTSTEVNIFINGGPTSTPFTDTSIISNNVAIGNQAFSYASTTFTARDNIALGYRALYGSSTRPMSGVENIAIGRTSLSNNTSGNYNVSVGSVSLLNNTSGVGNVVTGAFSLGLNTTGNYNIVQGYSTLISNVTGNQNIAIGDQGLLLSTGSLNVGIGTTNGLSLTTGNSNTFIGSYTDISNGTFSTSTAIGARASVGCSNCMALGGTGVNSVNVGIGSTTPSRTLTVNGDIHTYNNIAAGSSTITYASSTGLTATNATFTGATTSSLYATTLGLNSEYFTDLTGTGLQNTSNALTCITSNSSTFGCLTSEDWSIFNNKVSSTSIDTSAELASLITDETGSAGNLVFSGNPLLAGFRSSASSTIGDGTGAGGLTINGSATTTGGSYIAGGTMRIVNGTGNTYGTRNDGILFARSDFPTTFQNKISNSFSGVAANTSMNFELTNTTGTGHVAALSLFGTGDALFGKDIGLGTTTPTAYLTIGTTTLSGAVVGGIKQYLGFVNSTESAVYYGDETYISNVPTATSTLVGNMIRIADTSTLGNTVRGFEAQAFRGTNTKGENTGLSGFGRTFGVRGTTIGDAGDTFIPAGVFAESQGTTQGNALRAYSGTITTEELVSLFHDTGNFTGTGLQMNFGNAGGSFAATSSAKFVDFQVAGTSKFIVAANGSTTIGDGVTSASLRIPFGGICVDNDGSCISTTTGQIRSVTSALGNSDLAETYFSNQTLHAGEIVAISGGLSIKRAQGETEKDIIGVVSTKPGLTLGFDDTSLIPGERSYPIGLKGRVPIKLSTENGPIKKGDRIALSSIPGVGMKATESSRVVGIALEDYDGTRAYTAGFLNQFGDDMYKEKVTAQKNLDLRAQDGCSYGGGSALGEEECVAKTVSPIQAVTAEVDTTREDTLRAFARESALQTTSGNGEVAYVGQALMFIELTNYHIADETRMLSELASSTLLQNGAEGETIWSRLKSLAQNFVDGVLTVTGIKADRIEVTNELCVDGVCVTADDLRAILQNAHQGSQNTNTNTNTNTGDDGGSVNTDPHDPPPVTEEHIDNGGGDAPPSPQGETEEPPVQTEEQQPEEQSSSPEPIPIDPEPESQPEMEEPPAPSPEPPAPEPTV